MIFSLKQRAPASILAIALCLFVSNGLLARAGTGVLTPETLTVPKELGTVSERHSLSSTGSKFIVIIQDAHADYQAQKNFAGILATLAGGNGLRLILAEGGTGDISLRHLRGYSTPAGRERMADKMLKQGLFAGHEYLDVVSVLPLILWGIEAPELYESNLKALIRTEELRLELEPKLDQIAAVISRLEPRLLSE